MSTYWLYSVLKSFHMVSPRIGDTLPNDLNIQCILVEMVELLAVIGAA